MQYKEYHHTGNINKRKTIYLTRKKYFKLKKKRFTKMIYMQNTSIANICALQKVTYEENFFKNDKNLSLIIIIIILITITV